MTSMLLIFLISAARFLISFASLSSRERSDSARCLTSFAKSISAFEGFVGFGDFFIEEGLGKIVSFGLSRKARCFRYCPGQCTGQYLRRLGVRDQR